jgi:anthranilate/para-aminobenzoate synthase component I
VILARDVPIAPDPLAVARRLACAGGRCLALLHTAERGEALPGTGRWSFVAADPDRATRLLDPLADDPDLLEAGPLAFVPRWIGVIPYEARRALERPAWSGSDARAVAMLSDPAWHRYPAVACVDHHEGRVLAVGRERSAVERLARVLRAPVPPSAPAVRVDVEEGEPPARHAERIAAALELIRRGDLYQVNLARRLSVRLRAGDPLALYAGLARRAPTPFGAFLVMGDGLTVLSTSPELLLRAEPLGGLYTAPIKGTRPRGRDAAEDAALARELDLDPKERAELTMIVDVERNDLGGVAATGSVRLISGPRVTTHRTVHHRVALIGARARPGVGRGEILAAMVPSGSVTGAPKVRAMEVIAGLEAARRGLYTGGIGFVGHDGGVTLAMAIRTAVLRDGVGEYWAGGGIVADSDPAREVEETRWKALQILRAAAEG